MSSSKSQSVNVACADCETIAAPRPRLTGNRSRHGLVLTGAALFAIGGISLAAAVILAPPPWEYPDSDLVVTFRVLALVGLGLGSLILLFRLAHASVDTCSACGSTSIVPLDTPRGQAMSRVVADTTDDVDRRGAARGNSARVALISLVILFVAGSAGVGAAAGYERGRERGELDESRRNTSSYPPTYGGSSSSGHRCVATPNLESFPIQDRTSRDCVTSPSGLVVIGDMTQTVTSLERVPGDNNNPLMCAAVKITAGPQSTRTRSVDWTLRDPAGAERGPNLRSPSLGETRLVPHGSAILNLCFDDPKLGGTYLVIDPPDRMAWRSIWVFKLDAPAS